MCEKLISEVEANPTVPAQPQHEEEPEVPEEDLTEFFDPEADLTVEDLPEQDDIGNLERLGNNDSQEATEEADSVCKTLIIFCLLC